MARLNIMLEDDGVNIDESAFKNLVKETYIACCRRLGKSNVDLMAPDQFLANPDMNNWFAQEVRLRDFGKLQKLRAKTVAVTLINLRKRGLIHTPTF